MCSVNEHDVADVPPCLRNPIVVSFRARTVRGHRSCPPPRWWRVLSSAVSRGVRDGWYGAWPVWGVASEFTWPGRVATGIMHQEGSPLASRPPARACAYEHNLHALSCIQMRKGENGAAIRYPCTVSGYRRYVAPIPFCAERRGPPRTPSRVDIVVLVCSSTSPAAKKRPMPPSILGCLHCFILSSGRKRGICA